NRDKFFDNLNELPEIKLTRDGAEIFQDSVKTSLKSARNSVKFIAAITDKNAREVTVNYILGQGEVMIDNVKTASVAVSVKDKFEINVTPVFLGINEVEVAVKDEFGEMARRRIQITAFENINPKAELLFAKVSGFEYEIDASQSRDGDEKFGGIIAQYIYKIDGQTITVNENKIKYNFGSAGTFPVSVQVVDNDGGVSTIVQKSLVAN